jgi:hypothetical protein
MKSKEGVSRQLGTALTVSQNLSVSDYQAYAVSVCCPPAFFIPTATYTMSISVDDLVASLSSNHIGQEAIDLATLQVRQISKR